MTLFRWLFRRAKVAPETKANVPDGDRGLDSLYPLIVPSRYLTRGVWDLPHHAFPNSEYILTWVFFSSESSMSYIMREDYDALNKNHEGWQQAAFENLRNSLGSGNFYTNYRTAEDGRSLAFIIFSNEDGIGSSRILLSHELSQGFPEGYMVVMPDRAMGIVVSKKISNSDSGVLRDLIDEYYGCTGTAMSKEIMSPKDFLLPGKWLEPIDTDLSEWMVNEILTFNE
ncbi:hypothetical protein HB364_30185 [Pseudoflavitalea sp. X16]|uniref:hypothetical protein n=1 Tax=Paraflavitalea devenefica TaxID=2716334 RepID=UPI00141ED1EB|nr:hypothetical protein [Paraflavitalea devenefica]NII29388.1 hypothetical protein [Paraflavitalea devenefica]